MDSNRISVLKSSLDGISHAIPDENIEYWLARDLMGYLGYARWENFVEAIRRAETACSSQGNDISSHFRDVTKMVDIGIGKKREVADVMHSVVFEQFAFRGWGMLMETVVWWRWKC